MNDIDILKQEHKQWLALPQTKALLTILANHKDKLVGVVASSSMREDRTAKYIRLVTAQLDTTMTLIKVVSDTDTFIHNCSKQTTQHNETK